MEKEISYRRAIYACYMANISQAVIVTLPAILFLPLKNIFNLSYSQLGLLVFVNFFTQILCDIGFSGVVDKWGFKVFVIASPILSLLGFTLFALAPVFQNSYLALLCGTIIFSGAGGVLELILSPLVNAIPTKEKVSAMSNLHAFYSIGQVITVILATLGLMLLGSENWQVLVVLFLIVPVLVITMFSTAKLPPTKAEEGREPFKSVVRNPYFYLCFFCIMVGGSAEVTISQWASAFFEQGLGLNKVLGDMLGLGFFALMLGLGRLLSARLGARLNLLKFMTYGSLVAFFCYIVIGLNFVPIISLIACGVCGFAVSLLWPGTLLLASDRFSSAGTWTFAIFAAGGDIGASGGPFILSLITDNVQGLSLTSSLASKFSITVEQVALRLGILFSSIFALACFIILLFIARNKKQYLKKLKDFN